MLSLLLGRPRDPETNVPVTSANTMRDDLLYPYRMDPFKTGRIATESNEAVLPNFQGRDWLGTNLLPFMTKRPYLTRYRTIKRDLEIETPTHDMLDPFLISYANHYMGDYGIPYEGMVDLMDASNSTYRNSKPMCDCHPNDPVKCKRNGILYRVSTSRSY